MLFRPAILPFLVASGLFAMSAVADDLGTKLPEKPGGIGHPAADRASWDPLAATSEGAQLLKQAESLLKEPMPAFARFQSRHDFEMRALQLIEVSVKNVCIKFG